jgi:diketogulonate reductase-like aldo/keto reductase
MKHYRFEATASAPAVSVPVVGQGTWRMGDRSRMRSAEVEALRAGFDLGLALVDTAEMYGNGGAEEVVAEAIRGRRDGVFLVSKVLPGNASKAGTIRAAEQSLRRLRTDRLDLYLLHWPGSNPLEETLAAFRQLVEAGKIVRYGLSNFDTDGMESALQLPGGDAICCDQVLYNLGRRGIERNLLPWCLDHRVLLMAYSPVEQGEMATAGKRSPLGRVAERHGVTPAQIALAWTIREPGVVTIPKAADPEHVRQNAAAGDIVLTLADLDELDAAFPRPARDIPLETA